MWPLVTYSNCFKTVAFLFQRKTSFRYVCIKHCNTVSLYTINNDYTRSNISGAWFLGIRISTCYYSILLGRGGGM